MERVAPIAMATANVSRGELSRQVAVIGTTSDFLEVRNLSLGRGQFLPVGDLHRGAPLAVIGEKVAEASESGVPARHTRSQGARHGRQGIGQADSKPDWEADTQ